MHKLTGYGLCRRNVKYMAHDATELELPMASFDVVFSNWLLMYLSDDEVSKLAADALCWVRSLLFHYTGLQG